MYYKYVLGIDGGGTKTVCLLADQNGVIRGRGENGSSNPFHINKKFLKNVLYKTVRSAIISSNLSQCEIINICLGIAGAGGQEKQKLIRSLVWEVLVENRGNLNIVIDNEFEPNTRIQVYGDTVIALVAGSGVRHGIVVISGTGSVIHGETLDGRAASAGGWGALLADEGSGYYIGIQALRSVVRAYDGRDKPTILTQLILEQWEQESPRELFYYILQSGPKVPKIASLTRTVNQAALVGDEVAIEILSEAAKELSRGVLAVANRLGLNAEKFPIILAGGVLRNIDMVTSRITECVRQELPLAEISRLAKEPAYGAVALALQAVKRSIQL